MKNVENVGNSSRFMMKSTEYPEGQLNKIYIFNFLLFFFSYLIFLLQISGSVLGSGGSYRKLLIVFLCFFIVFLLFVYCLFCRIQLFFQIVYFFLKLKKKN